MSPAVWDGIKAGAGFPRVSGDEPWTNRWRWWGYSFSPRERG